MVFLPCLSNHSQICGSYLWSWCLGQCMYRFFLCSRATVSRWNLYLWSWRLDLFWNTIILVLLRFPVWQNLNRRSRCCCSPPWLMTEAQDHQKTVDIWLQILVGWGRVLQTFLVPTPIRLYICWRGWGLSCIPVSPHGPVGRNVFFAYFNHTLVVCVHGFYVVYFSPTQLSINLYSRPSCQIESKAFLKSTEH